MVYTGTVWLRLKCTYCPDSAVVTQEDVIINFNAGEKVFHIKSKFSKCDPKTMQQPSFLVTSFKTKF